METCPANTIFGDELWLHLGWMNNSSVHEIITRTLTLVGDREIRWQPQQNCNEKPVKETITLSSTSKRNSYPEFSNKLSAKILKSRKLLQKYSQFVSRKWTNKKTEWRRSSSYWCSHSMLSRLLGRWMTLSSPVPVCSPRVWSSGGCWQAACLLL